MHGYVDQGLLVDLVQFAHVSPFLSEIFLYPEFFAAAFRDHVNIVKGLQIERRLV